MNEIEQLMGKIRTDKVRRAAVATDNALMDQKKRHAANIKAAEKNAYEAAMLDFMYFQAVKQEQDQPSFDISGPLPQMGP